MIINHLNLSVNDVAGSRVFLEKYFGLQSVEGTNPGDTFIAMRDEAGFVLTLMEKKENLSYPKTFHLGFLRQGKEKMFQIYERLKEDQYAVDEPGLYRGTKLNFYVTTPFGFTIQISE